MAVGYENLCAPPAAASARGVPSDQAIDRAEEFAVDLQISRARASVIIVGQITDIRRPARLFSRVRVCLLADDKVGRLIRIPVRPKQMAS